MPFEPKGIEGLKAYNVSDEVLAAMQARAKRTIKKKYVKELIDAMERVKNAKDKREEMVKNLFAVLRIAVALGFRIPV